MARTTSSLALAVALALGALGAGCPPPASVVEEAPLAGPFSTRDAALVDADGGELLLRGVNLSQTAKAPPFHPLELGADGDDEDAFAQLRAHGPLAIRYLTSWAAIEPEDGRIDEAYLDGLAARVHRLAQDGHWIVLDLHQDLFGVGFTGGNGAPRFACDEAAYGSFVYTTPWFQNYQAPEVQGCFDALFADDAKLGRMAAALARAVDVAQQAARTDDGEHLIGVDLVNEPHPGSSTPAAFDARLARYYQLAADALDGTGLLLLFEPDVTHNLNEPTHLERAPAAGASVFAPHLYPFDAELGRYSDVGALGEQLARFAAEAEALEAPLAIGEMGPLLTDPARLQYVDDALYFLDELRASSLQWDWSAASDRGLLHDGADDVRARLLRPHARRVAGHVVDNRFDAEQRTLTVAFEERGARGATEVVWPSGWGEPVIDDDGDGEVERRGALLVWRHAIVDDGAVHRLTVRGR